MLLSKTIDKKNNCEDTLKNSIKVLDLKWHYDFGLEIYWVF